MTGSRIQIGISACVAGEKVRFDSGHKESRFVTGELSRYFSLLPVCPEIGIGLPVPRPTIRLISDRERVALVEGKNQGRDYTERMTAYAKNKVAQLERMELCGYIVCAKSPTCGMERVKVYREQRAEKDGVGLYTAELIRQMPWLPVEEDGRLNDPPEGELCRTGLRAEGLLRFGNRRFGCARFTLLCTRRVQLQCFKVRCVKV